jgi:hypothetical protein
MNRMARALREFNVGPIKTTIPLHHAAHGERRLPQGRRGHPLSGAVVEVGLSEPAASCVFAIDTSDRAVD